MTITGTGTGSGSAALGRRRRVLAPLLAVLVALAAVATVPPHRAEAADDVLTVLLLGAD
ncbi:MAG: hypothetical protein RLZZ272_1576, partial [Actinomycetota bacterium]